MRGTVRTTSRCELVDITNDVRGMVAASGVREGVATIWSRHTTAAITVNENADPDVVTDLLDGLERIAPRNAGWRHAEGNSDAHLKASLVGASESIPIVDGQLVLGTWQGIYFCEFDGPRSRTFEVVVVGK